MIEILGAGWVRFLFEQAIDLPVFLVGDFNGWDECANPLEQRENGVYAVMIRLAPGEYEFKYKCGSVWFNDSCAHKYVPNCWGSENSVVVVPPPEESARIGPAAAGDAAAAFS